jgi:hypothetical protein
MIEPMDPMMGEEELSAEEQQEEFWKPYEVKLDDDELEKLGRHLRHSIDQYHEAVEQRLDNCRQYRADFELMPTGRSNRWEGAADVPAHFTQMAVSGHHNKLNGQIIHVSPPFTARARSAAGINFLEPAEDCLLSKMEEADWPTVGDDMHLELPWVGNCFLRVTYEQEWKRYPEFTTGFEPQDYQDLLRAGADPVEAFQMAGDTDEAGVSKWKLEHKDKLAYDGIKFKVIKWEDGVILPATVRDPMQARGIGERLMIRGTTLKEGAAIGKYIPAAVEMLLTRQGDPEPEDRREVHDQQGTDPDAGCHGGEEDPLYREYLCYELCWQMDANGDGREENVVVTFHHETSAVLGIHYNPYMHGEPYYHLFRFYRRPGELWGRGIAETIAALQDAGTAVWNQLIDHGDYTLNTWGNFFYDDYADFDPTKVKVQLGTPIKVGDVKGLKEFPSRTLSPEHYTLFQSFKDAVELVTATSNPSLGKATDTAKTLGEVQIVASQSNMISEDVAARVLRDWARVCDQVRVMIAQYGEGGEVAYRKSGRSMTTVGDPDDPTGTLPAEVLLQDIDFVPTGLGQLADMNSRIQVASSVMSTLSQHPLTAGNNEVQQIVMRHWLHEFRHPLEDKIMLAIQKGLAAQQAVAMAEMQAQLQAPPPGMGGEGVPPPEGSPPGGAPPAASLPENQGPQGAPLGAPGSTMGPNGMPLPPIPGGYRG